jgi:hypothetical protein
LQVRQEATDSDELLFPVCTAKRVNHRSVMEGKRKGGRAIIIAIATGCGARGNDMGGAGLLRAMDIPRKKGTVEAEERVMTHESRCVVALLYYWAGVAKKSGSVGLSGFVFRVFLVLCDSRGSNYPEPLQSWGRVVY